MPEVAPRSAARRLAVELKLPPRKGVVLCAVHGDENVLVVAADAIWRQRNRIPTRYCGFRVEQDEAVQAVAHH